MKRDIRDELIRQATDVRQRSYAPYSKCLVGTALRATGGQTFLGCTVESAYGLATCAERSAVFAAVAAGQKQFECLAIAVQGIAPGKFLPCAACRQVLSEFNPDLPIAIVDVDNPEQVVEASLWTLVTRVPASDDKKGDDKKAEKKPQRKGKKEKAAAP